MMNAEEIIESLRGIDTYYSADSISRIIDGVSTLQSRLEAAEKDAARLNRCVSVVSGNIDFALSICEERGADGLAIEELKEARHTIDTAMQTTQGASHADKS